MKIITDLETGESKGYGFVIMEDPKGAERAIAALDGASIDERIISVRLADEKQDNQTAKITFIQQTYTPGFIKLLKVNPADKSRRPRKKS